MALSEKPVTTDAARLDRAATRQPFGSLASRAQGGLIESASAALWKIVHPLGAHRWRDGYVVDEERGWTQYRGSRCTICDEPWEGW